MKSTTKRIATVGIAAAYALTLFSGARLMQLASANAETNVEVTGYNYFYDHLTVPDGNGGEQEFTLAKKFYKVLDEMARSGDFVDGVVSYPLIEKNIVTTEQVIGYAQNGELIIPKAFGAARDAYLTDHPEIFYVDFYKLTISVGKKGGTWYAYIDSGREANVYYDNGFNSPAAVTEAIERYETKINNTVDEVSKKQSDDKYSERDAYLAREVNRYLAENITYDYAAYEGKDDPNYVANAYIGSSYGGIVERKAVCGGFSTAYKVIMDRLGIPCITVNGYSNQKDEYGNVNGASVYHMWNYVWLKTPADKNTRAFAASTATGDGAWYSVDVTWNSSASYRYRYALLNESADAENHVTDGVISSTGYKLQYPALSPHFYGSTGETDGLQCSRVYEPTGEKDDYGNELVDNYSIVSYNGKSAKALWEEDGLYLVCRFAIYDGENLHWFNWFSLEKFRQFAILGLDNPYGDIQDNGKQTKFYDNTSIYYTQFAVFDIEPDVPDKVHSDTLGIYGDYYYRYSDDIVNENKAVEIKAALVNESYGTYTPAPYISKSNPNHQVEVVISDSMRDNKITEKVVVAEDKAFEFEITYDETLHILDESKPIGISFVSEHSNTSEYAKFFPLDESGTLVELVERPKNSGDPTLVKNTLRFKFAPSLMYEHNREGYHFIFTNVGSAKEVVRIVNGKPVTETSDKLPNPAYYSFGREYITCPACFNYDGRLWVECCAQPTLVANSDLSAMEFKDENGESTFSEHERSQMMLVAEKASTETVDTMLDEITASNEISVDKNDIKTSETYDIALQICGRYPTIPDGSYVKIALGFPEGYGPEDEGVTFKLFHRKHLGGDNYIIEEVPCVVTQFGIVATVTSFSPYMVAVVDADKATDKTIFASIEGKGGKLTLEDGKIRSLKEGESYTYTIMPDKGYQLYSVTLNGVDVKDRVSTKGGKLTLNYSELQGNNELEIKYIADEAVARFNEQGIEIVSPAKVVVSTKGDTSVVSDASVIVPKVIHPASNNALVIGLSVSGVVIVAAAAIAVTVVLMKRKNKKDEAK